MRPFPFPLFLVFVAIFVRQSGRQSATLDSRRAELKRFLKNERENTLRASPELATMVGDNRYNDRLSDFSDKAIAEDLEHSRQALKKFEAFGVTGFPEQEERAKAQQELGPKFDLRTFHDAILDESPLPLDVLETKIMEWIKQQK